jgi:hypothetical protein
VLKCWSRDGTRRQQEQSVLQSILDSVDPTGPSRPVSGSVRHLRWEQVGFFLALAFGLTWLLDLLRWLAGGLRVPAALNHVFGLGEFLDLLAILPQQPSPALSSLALRAVLAMFILGDPLWRE